MPRPRILHCVSHLALGGAERVALTLIEALRDEFDFGVYAVRGLGDGEIGRSLARELHTLGLPLYQGPRIPMRLGGMITGGVGMARAVRRFQPEIIHVHTEIPEAAYATMITARPRLSRIQVVRTIHNAVVWAFWPSLGRWCDRRLAHAYVAGVSAGAVDAHARLRHNSGATPPPEPAVVIYNGLPRPSRSQPHRTDAESRTHVRLVFGGRLELEKGADLLPSIVERTRVPAGQTVHLAIYGSGKYERLLRDLSKRAPTGWTIALHPPIPDFRQKLGEFDLLVIPSRYEGLPLIAVEAALAGVPIVGTNAAGLNEALPANHPWVARVGNAASFAENLSAALVDRRSWSETTRVAREFAEQRFDARSMSAGYRALYGRTLSAISRPKGITPA